MLWVGRLNVHPPLYDAYGMTIVEAASQGVASIIHRLDGWRSAASAAPGRGAFEVLGPEVGPAAGGAGPCPVGACDLLRGEADVGAEAAEYFAIDLTQDEERVAARVAAWLGDAAHCQAVGARARGRVLAWNMEAFGARLQRSLAEAVPCDMASGLA